MAAVKRLDILARRLLLRKNSIGKRPQDIVLQESNLRGQFAAKRPQNGIANAKLFRLFLVET